MSTTDPDVRDRSAGRRALWALTIVIGVVGLLAAPVLTAVPVFRDFGWFGYLVWPYLALVAAAGYLAQSLPGTRTRLAAVAYVLAVIGGVLLFLGVDAEQALYTSPVLPFLFLGLAVVAYVLAIIATVDFFIRDFDRRETLEHGVTATGTITADVLSGIQHVHERHRLTVKFTDATGVDRWTHATRIGGDYALGDPIQVRYDPQHPGRNRAVLIEG
ncbi:MAG: DUF3592 domain-containing protein [Actinomycetota bacterium]